MLASATTLVALLIPLTVTPVLLSVLVPSPSCPAQLRPQHFMLPPLVKAQLYSLAKRAIELHQMITDTEEIEGWVQSHIAVANDNINSVYQFMDYGTQTLEEPAPEPEAVDIVDELPPVEMESIDPSIAKRWDKIVVNATKELESA